MGTKRPSTHLWRLSNVSFWRWRLQATDIARSFRPNTSTCPLGSCTPVLACVSCLTCSGQRLFWPAPRPHSVSFARYRRAFCLRVDPESLENLRPQPPQTLALLIRGVVVEGEVTWCPCRWYLRLGDTAPVERQRCWDTPGTTLTATGATSNWRSRWHEM